MDLVQSRRAYSRVNNISGRGHDADDFIALNTFASGASPELDGDSTSQFEYSSTYHLRHDSHQDDAPVKQSTTTAFSGWRLGAWTGGCLAVVSLVINLVAAIYLATHRDAQTSLVEVYKGDCNKVQSLDLWIHLLINLVSTLLLGGSNYCMQCLCSPSRDELDRAHAKGIPLDIGVPSPRNLSAVSKLKRSLWWILAFSSVPLHLMYNSAFYTSVGARDYNFYVVTPDFLAGHITHPTPIANWSASVKDPARVYEDYAASSQFKNFTNLECIQAYAKVIPTDWSTLLLVTRNSSSNYSAVASSIYRQGDSVNPSYSEYYPFDWICTGDPDLGSKTSLGFSVLDVNKPPCDEYVSKVESVADEWVVLDEPVDYCLAEPAEQQCTFSGNIPIVLVVLICNLIKAIIMIYLAMRLPGNPLITIGDAIQSFLDKPDPTTRGLCWATRRQILDYATYAYHFPHAPWPANAINAKSEPQTVSLRDRRWFNAAGTTRWVSTVVFLCIALTVSIGLFLFGYLNIYGPVGSVTTNQSIKQLGFGVLQPLTIISGGWTLSDPAAQILVSVLIANLPQVVLSFLYLNLNGLMTSMWLADEWHRFATQRKYLRVSSPKGNQRSTHFLQLPYKISVPLLVMSGLLHWLLSRSIFLAVISEYSETGILINATLAASCGYSLLPIIVTIVFGFVIMFTALGLGFRRYDGRIPLVGSCSAAISAACHRPDWDSDAALKPVQYGALTGTALNSDVGHCCLTSAEVDFVSEGKKYAGY